MRSAWLAAVAVVGLCGTSIAAAEVYHFTDERGVLHFTNVPGDPRFRPLFPGWRVRSAAAVSRVDPSMLERAVADAADRYGVDPHLIKAIIKTESDFDAYAVSRAGALGLMQLMPDTAELLDVADPFDPEANILGGVRHLRELLDRFEWNLPLALAAYNAGALRVETAGGIPAISETRRYVQKVLNHYRDYERRAEVRRPIHRVTTPDGAILLTNSPGRYPVTAR
jgi:soluble lytic murein transglycosylase